MIPYAFLLAAAADTTAIQVPAFPGAIAFSVSLPSSWVTYSKTSKPVRDQPTRSGQVYMRIMPNYDLTLGVSVSRDTTKESFLKGEAAGKKNRYIPIREGKVVGGMYFATTTGQKYYGQPDERLIGSALVGKDEVFSFIVASYKGPIAKNIPSILEKIAASIKAAPAPPRPPRRQGGGGGGGRRRGGG